MSKIENNNNEGQDEFALPDGYFQTSANVLKNKMEWLEEHRVYPALKMAWRNDIFAVPKNYFEKKSVALENVPYKHLLKIKDGNVFQLPQNYFEELNLLNESEPIFSVPKEQRFELPAAYFEKSAKVIYERLARHSGGARIISMRVRNWQLAAAAVFLITLGWWSYQRSFTEVEALDCGGIACVDRHEILQGKSLDLLDEEDLQNIVNVKRLEEGLGLKDKKELPNSDSSFSEEDLLDNL